MSRMSREFSLVLLGAGILTAGYFLAPAPEDDNLTSDVELKARLDERLKAVTKPPKVRIAAHGDIPNGVVNEVLNGLEDRRLALVARSPATEPGLERPVDGDETGDHRDR